MQNNSVQFGKLVLFVCVFFSIGTVLGIIAYLAAHPRAIQSLPTPSVSAAIKAINGIEISSDQKSILNSETKETLLTISDAKKYLQISGYAYNPDTFQNTNAKYTGDCFMGAALSNKKDKIVFSTGCLPGDLPEAWIGFYDLTPNYNGKILMGDYSKIRFLAPSSGSDFVWSADDKTITYEAILGLSGNTETRTIDSATGENLEKKDSSAVNENSQAVNDPEIKKWKTYSNEEYGFGLKYPKMISPEEETKAEVSKRHPAKNAVQWGVRFPFDSDSYINISIWYKEGAPAMQELLDSNYKKETIGGYDALIGREYGNAYFMEAYIFKNSYVYEIQYAGMENKDYINIYNKILSTFKFTK